MQALTDGSTIDLDGGLLLSWLTRHAIACRVCKGLPNVFILETRRLCVLLANKALSIYTSHMDMDMAWRAHVSTYLSSLSTVPFVVSRFYCRVRLITITIFVECVCVRTQERAIGHESPIAQLQLYASAPPRAHMNL